MNTKRAKEIISEFQESYENLDIQVKNIHRLGSAYGYLEGVGKAEGLVEILRWVAEYKHSRFDTSITEVLKKWEAEK